MKTYREIYDLSRKKLADAGIGDANLDARLIMEMILSTDHNTLFAHPDLEVSSEDEALIADRIALRAARIPLQHITGHQEFMGIDFAVNGDVLVPRQDTECLVEEVLICTDDGDSVLDLCTGSGCILLSVMNYKNDIIGVGTDISEKALAVARSNRDRLGIEKAEFLQGDLFEAIDNAEGWIPKKFEVIVSNPPYIRTAVIDELEPEVREHDPKIALDGGDDGLIFYRRIIEKAGSYLKNYGHILLETGYDQTEDVKKLLEERGYKDINVIRDLSGNPRVVTGVWKGNMYV